MTPNAVPPNSATPPPHNLCPTPADKIARRAYEKGSVRNATDDQQRRDWIETEAELARESAASGHLTAEDERLLRQETERLLNAEHEISRILASTKTIAEAAPSIIQAVGTTLGWDACVFWVVDPKAKLLQCLDIWHGPDLELTAFEREARLQTFSPSTGLPGRVWVGETDIWTPDIKADPDGLWGVTAADAGMRGVVGFPVCGGGDCLAVVECFSRDLREPNPQLASALKCIGGQIGQFFERREAERRLQAEEHDRRVGREIQRSQLPKTTPQLTGYELGGRSLAPNTVGGDCFDFIPLPGEGGDCTGILVADASGHGIGSALMVSQTRAYLRGVALTTTDVDVLLHHTNQCLCNDPFSGTFVTAFLMKLNPDTRVLSYASAGHLPGYVLDARGQIRAVLDSTGVPLGIDTAGAFPAASVTLEPGDLVFLYTDGITEAAPRDGEQFGENRALEIVRKHQQQSPDVIVTALFVAVVDYCTDNCLDDLTAVVLKVDGPDDLPNHSPPQESVRPG